jgi:hypothetical protein
VVYWEPLEVFEVVWLFLKGVSCGHSVWHVW